LDERYSTVKFQVFQHFEHANDIKGVLSEGNSCSEVAYKETVVQFVIFGEIN
jgi:hypothetical protein